MPAALPAIVAGNRRTFDVLDVPTRKGSAGIGIDATEAEAMRGELKRLIDAHRRTLDQLATGVAIFGADQKLTFYNTAYRSLWELDTGFLDQSPTDSAVLDQLRAARKLPEEQDFRQWKAALHEAYRATETREHLWHLPDGRTLRVVTTPNPQGGVTYLFEDVTERLDLMRRYDALIRVQGETLDNLAEGVAVFGSDGRLRLHNPAFERDVAARSAGARRAARTSKPVIGWCRTLHDDEALWQTLRGAVTAIDNRDVAHRAASSARRQRDRSAHRAAARRRHAGHLPGHHRHRQRRARAARAQRSAGGRRRAQGRFRAPRVLRAALAAHQHHRLRALPRRAVTGPLNDKQREYLGYITSSTNALLAIINDILDLATIDAGAMTLNLGEVDIRRTMNAAAEGIRDRLVKDGIALDIGAVPDIGSFVADERRVRQVLFNLLANAVGFSPPGGTVTLAVRAARRRGGVLGHRPRPRHPARSADRVFDWFETHSHGSRHRGAGLGLSIVRSFVELHGGTVTLDSTVGRAPRWCARSRWSVRRCAAPSGLRRSWYRPKRVARCLQESAPSLASTSRAARGACHAAKVART